MRSAASGKPQREASSLRLDHVDGAEAAVRLLNACLDSQLFASNRADGDVVFSRGDAGSGTGGVHRIVIFSARAGCAAQACDSKGHIPDMTAVDKLLRFRDAPMHALTSPRIKEGRMTMSLCDACDPVKRCCRKLFFGFHHGSSVGEFKIARAKSSRCPPPGSIELILRATSPLSEVRSPRQARERRLSV
jgi:hypothetical protein